MTWDYTRVANLIVTSLLTLLHYVILEMLVQMRRRDVYLHIFDTEEEAEIAMFEGRLDERGFKCERRLIFHVSKALKLEGMDFRRGYPAMPPLVYHFIRGREGVLFEVEFAPGNPERILGRNQLLVTTTCVHDLATSSHLEIRLMIVRACLSLQLTFGPFEGITMLLKQGENEFMVQGIGPFDEVQLEVLHDALADQINDED